MSEPLNDWLPFCLMLLLLALHYVVAHFKGDRPA